LDSSPPKFADNSSYTTNKILRKNYGQVVNRDGSKNQIDISQSTRMIEFICFDGGELSSEFIDNKSIHFISIFMRE
jgi:hypothetical protein